MSSVPRCTGNHGLTHNALLKAAVFSQQGHFYTAWLQWVCVASWEETDNLNRRSSLVLMSHACTKNQRQLYECFFCMSGMKIVLLGWQCKPRPFVPKAQLHSGKKTVITQCIWWGCIAEGHLSGSTKLSLNISDDWTSCLRCQALCICGDVKNRHKRPRKCKFQCFNFARK